MAKAPVWNLPAILRIQAEHCARLGSPLYADLLERAAEDAEAGGAVAQILRGHEDDPPNSMLALRMMGAVRRRVLEGALPDLGTWADMRTAIATDAESIRALLDRPVQTNEVGRCAALLPGFFAAARAGLPLRLLEVGASAGLNLRFDRYRYEANGFTWGPPDSAAIIGVQLEGDAPEPAPVEIAERRGCDPQPLDPATDEGRLTLLSFVWPDQAERLGRLHAALAAAEDFPVAVERGRAAGWIGERLAEPRPATATVVFHSIVMQYLPEEERAEFEQQLSAVGGEADVDSPLFWLRMEPAGERAEVRLTRWPGGEERVLARVGYHGTPVQLLR
jgi:hypothetical protein